MDDPSPLDFLKAVYLDPELPLSVRMRAAIEAAPYCHPKLTATANLDPQEFSIALEKAITRSGVRLIEGRLENERAPADARGPHVNGDDD